MGNIKVVTGLFLCMSLFLAACSGQTYSQINCAESDMATMGHDDAMSGKVDRSETLKASCEGIDVNEYLSAYNKGMDIFCEQTKPFNYGLEGSGYADMCGSEFDDDYALGYRLFDLKHEIWKHENQIDRSNNLISNSFGLRSEHAEKHRKQIRESRAAIAILRIEQIDLRNEAVEKGFLDKGIFSK